MENKRKVRIGRSLNPVPRKDATIEAEKGETILTNLSGDGIPEFYEIKGKPHNQGGTPLFASGGSFIFSKDKKMKIKDPEVLKQFGYSNPKKAGYTPAEISKKFDNSKARETLVNPMSDKISVEAAEKLIANYNEKHGLLALVQESQKGFPTGIPKVSAGYLEATGIDIEELSKSIEGSKNEQGQPQAPQQEMQMKYGGENLEKYDDGGQPQRKRKTLAPKNSVVWDTSLPDFNPNDVMNGDYVVVDGVVKKVSGLRKANLEGSDYKDERLGAMQSAYGTLAKKLENEEVREKIYDKYIDRVAASKLPRAEKDRLIALPEDEVIETFLKQQQQVAIVDNRHGLRDEDGKLLSDVDQWDRGVGADKNKKYKSWASENNMDIMSEDDIKVAQGVFQAIDSLKDDPSFSNFKIAPTGKVDSKYGKDASISEIDGFAGNTFMGQAVGVFGPNEYDTEDLDYEDEEEPQNLTQVAEQKETPFWLQDDVNLMGAIGERFGLKKQTPLELTGNVSIPNPTFYSPDQAIQNVLSSQKTATEGAKAFGSAADYANFANALQSKGASQVANQIANVQNQNVGISNQFADRKAQLMNQDSAIKAASKMREWDKRNLVDANYDNAATAANAKIRDMFNNRWTNRGMTQTLNERDDQFDVDPRTGFTYYTGVEKQLDPSKVQSDIFQTAQNIMTNAPGMEAKDAFDYAMRLRGMGGSKAQS